MKPVISVCEFGPRKVTLSTGSLLTSFRQKGITMEQNRNISRAAENALGECQSRPSSSSNAKARLLLVEDHDVNQILIQAMTKRLGYETELASDGTEAVAQVNQSVSEKHPFDLVLMDIQMPFMDGYEATRMIRANGISAETLPIIAITANAFADDIRNCLDAGMQAHISKPVDISNLESVLQQWLAAKKPEENESTTKAVQSDLSDDLVRRYKLRKEDAISSVVGFVGQGVFSEREITDIRDQLHKLAGTAAMFGERELGEQAKLIEDGLEQWTVAERPNKIARALETFLEAARTARD
ncbi:MAG: hypothetical protein COZ43_02310 [Sphingomonadales bacterium CG_4_10_14_3_um_filter_58_15]|nr:MAG: hypothetical protein COZ43_02310 [Sphingomonadales bacterium CG_4_10_14_3_um_filter_58_15]